MTTELKLSGHHRTALRACAQRPRSVDELVDAANLRGPGRLDRMAELAEQWTGAGLVHREQTASPPKYALAVGGVYRCLSPAARNAVRDWSSRQPTMVEGLGGIESRTAQSMQRLGVVSREAGVVTLTTRGRLLRSYMISEGL